MLFDKGTRPASTGPSHNYNKGKQNENSENGETNKNSI
jgi:hypothetical protein